MKLTAFALSKVNTPKVRRVLAVALHCTEQTIIRHITKNEENSPLTLLAAIEAIEEYTGLTQDKIISR